MTVLVLSCFMQSLQLVLHNYGSLLSCIGQLWQFGTLGTLHNYVSLLWYSISKSCEQLVLHTQLWQLVLLYNRAAHSVRTHPPVGGRKHFLFILQRSVYTFICYCLFCLFSRSCIFWGPQGLVYSMWRVYSAVLHLANFGPQSDTLCWFWSEIFNSWARHYLRRNLY
jgi:hypothetical protein